MYPSRVSPPNIMELENINLQNLNNNGRVRTDNSSADGCIRRLLLTLVLLFVLLMVIIGIAWLVMNPHLPDFQLTSLSVANFTVSGSKLTGHYRTELTVINPNKKVQVLLDHFDVRVCYGKVEFSEPTKSRSPKPPASYQLEKMGHMNLTFPSESMGRPPKMWRRKIPGDLRENLKKGVVNFNVKVQVRIRFEAGNWPTEEKFLVADCRDLDVYFFDKAKGTGNLLGIERDCHVSVES